MSFLYTPITFVSSLFKDTLKRCVEYSKNSKDTDVSNSDSESSIKTMFDEPYGTIKPYPSEILSLDSPEKLYLWLSRPLDKDAIKIRYLYLTFDLKFLRNIKFYNLFFSKLPLKYNNQLSNLKLLNLTTKGFNFYIENNNLLDFNENNYKIFNNKKFKRNIISLDLCLEKLLSLLINFENSPLKFIWKSKNPIWFEYYNEFRQNNKYNFPKMPNIIFKWTKTNEFEFPYLVRPIWKSYNYNGKSSSIPIEKITIPAQGLHKWSKGYAMGWLIRDIMARSRGGKYKMILEIKGYLPKKRLQYKDRLMSDIQKEGAAGVIIVIWNDKEE
ncbi:uncharacterized protein I206_107475 [Kwoniella pini CBS 10737]|uniref:Uncharacterized protein n=1 Tax=Kwoniella pini CBS 10737 TaxID=1296096 RepID=A0A1B9HXD6_9TREE|nr:uncharacterized protein I206_05804 [Kwoniella pini CBS 10737]OCF47939.1 hypothetical protein I206_05804 [Kwoniella pini CBS 10737]